MDMDNDNLRMPEYPIAFCCVWCRREYEGKATKYLDPEKKYCECIEEVLDARPDSFQRGYMEEYMRRWRAKK